MAQLPRVAVDWIPATIEAAPNRMKQPTITVAPYRQLIRPVSIMNPTAATAMIATTVATVPSNVPCSQRTADTNTPDPAGSLSESCACATLALIMVPSAASNGAIRDFIKRNTPYPSPDGFD